MAISPEEREVKKIVKKTIDSMNTLNIYRPQFLPTIQAYSNARRQLDCLQKQFADSGYLVMEKYTNKNGSVNLRKTALYLSIETLRKDVLNYENTLGLTPTSLKRINNEMESKKKRDMLGEALKNAKV